MADLLSRLPAFRLGLEGYGTTDRERTRDLYRPLLLDHIPGDWVRTVLVVIGVNGTIPPHHDKIAEGSTRHMAVLQSNSRSWVMHGGSWQQLEEGGIYTSDPMIEHSAVNWGAEPRIHLVVDVRA